MSDLTNVFTDIADAIRAKTETQITYKPTEMADAINNIETGGGGVVEITTSTLVSSFNMPVNIQYGVSRLTSCFAQCVNFNQPASIPNTVTNMKMCFQNCYNLNQPIIIPNNVTDMNGCFNGCHSFNQPIILPNNAVNMNSCFYNCYNFNQLVHIPNSVTKMYFSFQDCQSFNQPIIIPNNVTDMSYCFSNCSNFSSNIYLFTNVTSNSLTRSFLRDVNYSAPKHIFTNKVDAFISTQYPNTITGYGTTWTQDGANYYSTDFNIYIHNVANPYTVLNNESYYFNSRTPLPDSSAIVFGSGVRDLNLAFTSVSLNSSNTLILFEEGVENLYECFAGQDYFNQPVTIPSSAKDCSEIFLSCGKLNSDIVFRNGVESVVEALCDCQNFASDIWIPESVTNMNWLLDNSPYASGTIHISHNIALGNTDNYIYNSLVNGEIGITLDPARILNDY